VSARVPAGGFVTLDGRTYYAIADGQAMPPFLVTVASDTDLWMFVASTGGLTAGRRDADGALFPYVTADRLYDAHHHTGPVTLVCLCEEGGRERLWRPFSPMTTGGAEPVRNLYKNVAGNRLLFEEHAPDLGLTFRYRWAASDAFGWVRTATLANVGPAPTALSVLDGLRNVLPFGAPLSLYQQSGNLVDAYKHSERDPKTGLGIFSLTAAVLDRAEPAESLRANTVWSTGLTGGAVSLSADAVDAFRRGEEIPSEERLGGRRGNYLVAADVVLEPGEERRWHVVADAGLTQARVAGLQSLLLSGGDLSTELEASLDLAEVNLRKSVGSADGLQCTARTEDSAHHFASVLFNTMRGGVAADGYAVPRDDFAEFLRVRNRAAAARFASRLEALAPRTNLDRLRAEAADTGDPDLQRLAYEYLPVYFGRRHGDPSRPWNRFSIHVRTAGGGRAFRYEGNWRDIFQNWEALCRSFPGFLPGIVAKFVNASTVDGFNPYRISRDGIEWETEDPDDPWSYIGYWGDHQIVYLLRFLEDLTRFSPGTLDALLDREIFSYADVPYRIVPYARILENPRATIVFDGEHDARIEARVGETGTDGRLVPRADGSVLHVNLLEKLVVPALSKLSNLVPDAGIWMNTQRPEWNDANNALVGNGVSVVTLCHLRRYLAFLETLLAPRAGSSVRLSAEVGEWLARLAGIFADPRLTDPEPVDDGDRRHILDALGEAFSDYRERIYARGLSAPAAVPADSVLALCGNARIHLERVILVNRRPDGLHHAYNLVALEPGVAEASIRPLYEMLEGQVAALASGVLDAAESADLLDRLFESRLWREDQRSFLLYPERRLPGFLEKNVVPPEGLRSVPLLGRLLAAGDTTIVERDVLGAVRFHADFANAADLARALDRLGGHEEWSEAAARERESVLALHESVFDHASFTGRSGTMYGYEGLGCIYWHMVAKLLLAVQETALRARREDGSEEGFARLARHYYRIRAGFGFEKTPAEYGAFPTDAHSHTPRHAGAQQPGMTGQVKEMILARFGELGVRVEDGILAFHPVLLRRREFRDEPARFLYYAVSGESQTVEVPAGSLAFTVHQVPVLYTVTAGEAWTRVTAAGVSPALSEKRAGAALSAPVSRALFDRTGAVRRIEVGVPERALLPLSPPEPEPRASTVLQPTRR